MEIRVGIKFKDEKDNICKVIEISEGRTKWFVNDKLSINTKNINFINYFKTNKFKLLEYPYKVGDWVYDINDTYISIRNKITHITRIKGDTIWCEDHYDESSSDTERFNETYRPCFIDEIPNYEEPIRVIEDYTYLIELFNKYNIK